MHNVAMSIAKIVYNWMCAKDEESITVTAIATATKTTLTDKLSGKCEHSE